MDRSIKRDFQYLSVSTIAISMLFLSGFWVIYDYRSLQLESERLREKYMLEYRDMLRSQVEKIIYNIENRYAVTTNGIRRDIKDHADEIFQVITQLFNRKEVTDDVDTLKKTAKEILRNISFNGGRGYYFIIGSDGTEVLPPPLPDQKDQVIADMLRVSGSSGNSFYHYTLSRSTPAEGAGKQINYLRYIPAADWIIGAGINLDDTIAQVQEDICKQVENIHFGNDNSGHVFIGTWDGISKTYPARGKNMLETRDANGLYIVKELISKARQGGGFVQYVMPALQGVQPKPKLSYANQIPQWQWYVGAGVYIDEVDRIIANNQLQFKDRIKHHLVLMLLGLIALLAIHSLASFLISRNIWKQLHMFSEFFRRARRESVSLDKEILTYSEFREIGTMANAMLEERNVILQEIRQSRDEWVNTFNAIGDCLMVLDADGTILRANTAAQELHKMTAGSIINTPFSKLCTQENPVDDTLADRLPHNAEVYNEKLNKFFLSSSFPIFTAEGTLDKIIHIAHDITEQKKLKEQLLQSQKMEAIGTLAGGIAHDFNNILGAIFGYAELAARDCSPGSPSARYINQITKAGGRAKDLVRQILVFSRQAETKRITMQPASIIKEALKLLRASLPATIAIEQDIEPEAGLIHADPTQFHQILINMVTNAFHAMEKTGGVLAISLHRKSFDVEELVNHPQIQPGDFIQLSISDSGAGIAPEIQERIFDPYFTTKEPGKGTGMGLAIVQGIVKSYGGFITFASRPGNGTVFHINLPVQDTQVGPEPPLSSPLLTGTERILFVDDEIMLVEMSRVMLEQLGYTVTGCTDSGEALSIVENDPDGFDLVITDHTMPGLTGLQLAERILKIRPQLPVILCTGYSESVSEESALATGIKSLAIKPLRMHELATLIRDTLSR